MDNKEDLRGSIERVYKVSDSLVSDCYYIVQQTRPNEAMDVYYDLRRDVEQRGHLLYVFNGPRFPLGFIKGQIVDADTAKIDWFFVDLKFRRRGIGQRLLAMYMATCKENNIKNLVLFSAPNQATLAFYKKNGFEQMAKNYRMIRSLER